MIRDYPLHLMILVLLWGYIYTSWSVMGRLGMVSFGHGAFMGIGAYTVVMLWNHYGVSPWIGALVTLARAELTRLIFVALREQTGGSLGATPNGALTEGTTVAIGALQFSSKWAWLGGVFAFWLLRLSPWRLADP